MIGRLSHYSALYEVQHEQGLSLDAVQHLHHMVHGGYNSSRGGMLLQYHCCRRLGVATMLPNTSLMLTMLHWRACRLQQHVRTPLSCDFLRAICDTGRAAVQLDQCTQ